jgi:hypothetical protein
MQPGLRTDRPACRPRRRFGARGALVAFLAALFIAAPVLALQHETRFGAGDHDHNGTPCEVWVIAKGFSGLGTVSAQALPLPRYEAIQTFAPPERPAPGSRLRPAARIRAPPFTVA